MSLLPELSLQELSLPPLSRDFYQRDTLAVANDLLGCWLVREVNGTLMGARIVETEAYCGAHDTACHAHRGLTSRTAAMFGAPGHAYVYLVYGMHWLLNIVTEPEGSPCAVLIRAVEPVLNEQAMRERRSMVGKQLCNGPGKLTRALGVDKALYGHDMTRTEQLWVSAASHNTPIASGPRVGIDYAEPEDRDAPWRFWLEGNSWVSMVR